MQFLLYNHHIPALPPAGGTEPDLEVAVSSNSYLYSSDLLQALSSTEEDEFSKDQRR